MLSTALKAFKMFEIMKNKGVQNIGKKVLIACLSPVIAFVFLIGGIFTDGINFNHNLINDLFNGVPVSTSGMDISQSDIIHEIESIMPLLNQKIDEENAWFQEGESLDVYIVKGFYIGIMLSNQPIHLNENNVSSWTDSFIQVADDSDKKDEKKQTDVIRHPIIDHATIFQNLEKNLKITLTEDTKQSMLKIVEGLKGSASSGNPVTTLSKKDIERLIKKLPEDTSELRKKIVIQAADAVGKIPYYWGGTATYPGYEGNNFGKPITPDEAGRNLKGLDCSHFVDWVYWTIMNNNLGNTNTEGQIAQCKKITMDDLKPGDLAFLLEGGISTHVGIYAGKNEKGEAVWIHENAGDNNVSMNTVSYWNLYCRLNIMNDK